MSFPNARYKDWHRGASKQLYRVPNFGKPNLIELTFFPKTKRGSDLTNKAESIMDLLVDNGVLLDDNWFIVGNVSLKFGAVDPKNPRVEIEINQST